MKSVMPAQTVPDFSTKVSKQNQVGDNINKSNSNEFGKVLKDKIKHDEKEHSKKQNIKESDNDNIAQEVAEVVKQLLVEQPVKTERELEKLISDIMQKLGIQVDDKEANPFIEDVKKSIKEINIDNLIKGKKELVSTDKLELNNDNKNEKISLPQNEIKHHNNDNKAKIKQELLTNQVKFNTEEIVKIMNQSENKDDDELKIKPDLSLKDNHIINSNQSDKQVNNKIETLKIEKPQDILKLVDMINVTKSGKNTKLSVNLHPAELGKVNIQLHETAGKITAKFIVDNDTTKSMLLHQVDAIKNQLSQKGIHIDDMQFMFTGDFKQQQQFAGGKNKGEPNKEFENFTSDLIVNKETEVKENEGLYA